MWIKRYRRCIELSRKTFTIYKSKRNTRQRNTNDLTKKRICHLFWLLCHLWWKEFMERYILFLSKLTIFIYNFPLTKGELKRDEGCVYERGVQVMILSSSFGMCQWNCYIAITHCRFAKFIKYYAVLLIFSLFTMYFFVFR